MEGISATYRTDSPPCHKCSVCAMRRSCSTVQNASEYSGSIYFNAQTDRGAEKIASNELISLGLQVRSIRNVVKYIKGGAMSILTTCKAGQTIILHKAP